MNKDELELLRSYENGPKIWDAASLMPQVWALADKGLIEPAGTSGAYRLIEAGRRVLRTTAPLAQKYVDEMLTPADQERLRTGAVKGIAFGNQSNVIVWKDDHFEEIPMAAYQRKLKGNDA